MRLRLSTICFLQRIPNLGIDMRIRIAVLSQHNNLLGRILIIANLIARLVHKILPEPATSLALLEEQQAHHNNQPIHHNEINACVQEGAILDQHQDARDYRQDIAHEGQAPDVVYAGKDVGAF